ncbi:hypothetical protein ACVBEF_17815 [Glaciimonas sp. GG7]
MLLGPPAAQDSKQLATQGFGRFVIAYRSLSTSSRINVGAAGLAWTGTSVGWAFTPGRQALYNAVTALMMPPYMKAGAALDFAEVPPGSSIVWDKAQLERAASLAEARKAFRQGAYTTLPTVLQQPASALVDLALAANAHRTLAQALSVTPAELPSTASDAERTSVLRIRAWLQDIGAIEVVSDIDGVLTRDALSRLNRLDEIFSAAEVFVLRDATFQSWKGEKGALIDAFGGGDAAGLGVYVGQQQEFIDIVSHQAEGVLAQLTGVAAGPPVVARWQAIVADLRRYRLKSPTSSLMALEQFIVNGSAEIDIGNCADKLSARLPQRRAADPFTERLQSLQNGLLARCRSLLTSRYKDDWEHFADAYNRDMGRRLPFSSSAAMPADREEVGAVMKLYERVRAASALAERDPSQSGARTEVRKVAGQLRRVGDLLAPLYPSEEGQVGGLDVTVQFRANAAAEAQANKIIDWSLTIGSSTVRLTEPPRALRWEPGMPVLLSLRLARDGDVAPGIEPGHPSMSVAERTVSFRFDDPWALFSFISTYRDVVAPGDDGRTSLLRFEFPLLNTGTTAQLSGARARVFLRIGVSAPGKHIPLAWPQAFPTKAPPW